MTPEDEEFAALEKRLAQANKPPPPPECQTDAEKAAYAFGYWKAIEEMKAQGWRKRQIQKKKESEEKKQQD